MGARPSFFGSGNCVNQNVNKRASCRFLMHFERSIVGLSPTLMMVGTTAGSVTRGAKTCRRSHAFNGVISVIRLTGTGRVGIVLAAALPTTTFN